MKLVEELEVAIGCMVFLIRMLTAPRELLTFCNTPSYLRWSSLN